MSEENANGSNSNDDESGNNKGKKMRGMLYSINKPKRASIIEGSKAKEFIDTIVKNRATKAYWDECSSTSKKLNSTILDELIRKSREE